MGDGWCCKPRPLRSRGAGKHPGKLDGIWDEDTGKVGELQTGGPYRPETELRNLSVSAAFTRSEESASVLKLGACLKQK